MSRKATGMIIDGVFASEALDSSGEVVSIEGMDISSMEAGEGIANYEHKGEDDGGFGKEKVGRVIYVKKIFKESDCEDERQRDYFKRLRGIPFLYGIVRLHDGAGHSGAKDLAAQIRDAKANGEMILVRYSIEGSTTEREGHQIKSSIARQVAMTVKPCNKTCFSDVIEDPFAPEGWLDEMGKNEDPSCRKIGGSVSLECSPCISDEAAASARLLSEVSKIRELSKAMTAGGMGGAPSTLTQGAALQREEIHGYVKNQAMAALRDYDERPWKKKRFKKFLKNKLPEADDKFLDHFADIAEAYDVRRSILAKKEVANFDYQGEWPFDLVKAEKASFQNGVLSTAHGQFNASRSKQASFVFQHIVSHPSILGVVEKAFEGWDQLNRLSKAGKLPQEIITHIVLLSKNPSDLPVEELTALRNGGLGQVPDLPPIHLRYLNQLTGGDKLFMDKHLVRHIFDLDAQQNADSIEAIYHCLSDGENEDVLYAMDEWYKNSLTAVSTGSLTKGSWLHWMAIKPHEEAGGKTAGEYKPMWEAIAPAAEHLLKNDWHHDTIPLRTALLHKQYIEDYGAIPAAMMYFAYIVPKLLDVARQREETGHGMAFLAKANELEAACIELRKNVAHALGEITHEMPRVHKVDLNIDGKRHPAGRYMLHNGRIHHLEDYHGILETFLPEGPIDMKSVSRLHGLDFSHHLDVDEHRPEFPEEAKVEVQEEKPARRESVFHYHRPGMVEPAILEFSEHGAALDGEGLEDEELALIMNNIETGVASVRYKELAKKEEGDDALANALQSIRAAVDAGHIHPDHERALTQHIYEDPMNKGVGNKYAYQQFRQKEKPGVWLSMDANDFKSVNDTHGHEAGDAAITSMGRALRQAADKVGTGKLFRPGGDEFVAHFPTHEDASQFARHATTHLNDIAPINGTHKLSMSFGLGHDFPTADKALLQAKEQKKDPISGGRAFPPGQTPHLAHSMVPGAEGAISLHTERPPSTSMPPQKTEEN